MEDRFRQAAGEKRTLLNAWLTLNSPLLIELIGEAGFDCITIDQQHGLGGNDVLIQCLTAARAVGLALGATPSSRSSTTTSAPDEAARANFAGWSPGTHSTDRRRRVAASPGITVTTPDGGASTPSAGSGRRARRLG